MNKEVEDRLFNKTKNELTLDDKRYIKALTSLKGRKIKIVLLSSLLSLVALGVFGPLAFLPGADMIAKIFCGIFGLTGLSAAVFTAIEHSNSMYKELGLTKKEYKELKKSGKIEELSKSIDNINWEDLRNLNIASSIIEDCQYEIVKTKQYRENLIKKMIANNQITKEEANKYLKKEKIDIDEQINNEEEINILN